jgi:hypothetical protein
MKEFSIEGPLPTFKNPESDFSGSNADYFNLA